MLSERLPCFANLRCYVNACPSASSEARQQKRCCKKKANSLRHFELRSDKREDILSKGRDSRERRGCSTLSLSLSARSQRHVSVICLSQDALSQRQRQRVCPCADRIAELDSLVVTAFTHLLILCHRWRRNVTLSRERECVYVCKRE